MMEAEEQMPLLIWSNTLQKLLVLRILASRGVQLILPVRAGHPLHLEMKKEQQETGLYQALLVERHTERGLLRNAVCVPRLSSCCDCVPRRP